MSKNVIFLIHGIGRHNEGWASAEDGPVETLVKAANYYEGFSEQDPLTKSVEFIEICYDDIFNGILRRWNELANELGALPNFTPDAITEVREAIQEYTDPKSWFASHAMDVFFYTHFKLVRRLVQLRVALQIMQTVAKYGTLERRYGVIAHSMGTAVVHDAIHQMASANWLSSDTQTALEVLSGVEGTKIDRKTLQDAVDRYKGNPFRPGKFSFEAIFMIANTSRLLHCDTPPPQESIVRPRFAEPEPQKYICSSYFNIQHVLDPIAQVKCFRCKEIWPSASTRGNAQDILGLNHIYDVNVHGLSHYLIHPLVHSEIFVAFAPHRFGWKDYQRAGKRVGPDGDFFQLGKKYRDEEKEEKILRMLSQLTKKEQISEDVGQIVKLYITLDKIFSELRDRFDD